MLAPSTDLSRHGRDGAGWWFSGHLPYAGALLQTWRAGRLPSTYYTGGRRCFRLRATPASRSWACAAQTWAAFRCLCISSLSLLRAFHHVGDRRGSVTADGARGATTVSVVLFRDMGGVISGCTPRATPLRRCGRRTRHFGDKRFLFTVLARRCPSIHVLLLLLFCAPLAYRRQAGYLGANRVTGCRLLHSFGRAGASLARHAASAAAAACCPAAARTACSRKSLSGRANGRAEMTADGRA